MDDPLLASDDIVIATVTASTPFGVLVETAGVPGLARSVTGAPGDVLRLRVLEFDAAQRRFSAERA